ncbi:MAG: YceI family protein [Candidatus Cybelea sp.]
MKHAFAAVLLASTLAPASPQPRAIDVARSSARFGVSHIWVERVTGTLPVLGGSVTLADGAMIPMAAAATLDATGVATGEPDRDQSLKSSDFFDVKRFPQWSFVSTKVTPHGANGYEMDGNLTIHGVMQPQRLNVTASGTPAHPVYHATAQIDRHAFGMAVTRLDPTIGASVDVTLDIVLQ